MGCFSSFLYDLIYQSKFIQNIESTNYFSDKEIVSVRIVLGRPLLNDIMTVYIPSVLMNIVGHISKHFQSTVIDVVISVNLTVLLVLATM